MRLHPLRAPGAKGLARSFALGLALGASLAGASPAGALGLLFSIDPAASSIEQGGVSLALSGFASIELGELPPPAAPTPMNLVGLAATAGTLGSGFFLIGLDDTLANPGLGVLFGDGTFLIPSLHLEVNGADLTVTELAGTLGPSAACRAPLCLETAFDVEPPAGGTIHVVVVAGAVVPEPPLAALAALATTWLLASTSLRRGSV